MEELQAWMLAQAKPLRKANTPQEYKLWSHLRIERFSGIHFRRQVSLGSFIVDYVSFEARLIIELGEHHLEQSIYDISRDAWLRDQGFRLLRFWSHEVDCNVAEVLDVIFQAVRGG